MRTDAVYGFNDVFRKDIQALLDTADAAGIRVEFTLFDFLVAGAPADVDGVQVRGREEIFTQAAQRADVLEHLLVPFLEEFGDHPALAGFDVLNEPEWLVAKAEGGAWEDVTDLDSRAENAVPAASIRGFATECAATVRAHAPGKWVTMGVSAPHVGLAEGLALDYRAVHYYPWMGPIGEVLAGVPDDLPWSLEEFPTNDTDLGLTDHLDAARAAGAAGALAWNLTPEADGASMPYSERNAALVSMREWIEAGVR